MLIENDFEHDDGRGQPDAPAPPPSPPLVVIQYRNRGIPLLLVPPVLVLAAVLGFQAHQRMTPPRPGLVLPPVLAADEGRPPEEGSTGAEDEAERFLARSESSARPALDPLGPLPTESPAGPATAPAAVPSADLTIVEEDRVPPPSVPEHVDEATATTPAPADSPALGPDPFQGPVPSLPPPEPVLTKEQVMERIRLESEREAARLQNLDAWKPHLLARDRKLGEEIKAFQVHEQRRLIEASRVAFHAELRKLVVALGDRAGPQIDGLCQKYGRVPMREVELAHKLSGFRTSKRLGRREYVEAMRRRGLPEAYILDELTRAALPTLNTRGGPRDRNGVRALAAHQLLALPPAPGADAARRPVAESSMGPVPGGGRRPQ